MIKIAYQPQWLNEHILHITESPVVREVGNDNSYGLYEPQKTKLSTSNCVPAYMDTKEKPLMWWEVIKQKWWFVELRRISFERGGTWIKAQMLQFGKVGKRIENSHKI